MHDPLTVAFTIVWPWPQRTSLAATGRHRDGVRWRMRLNHQHVPGCETDPPHKAGAFPWWKLSSYSRFWRLAGRDWYWPALITVWHDEPHGRDSGEVCPHYRRWQDEAGEWQVKVLHGWRFHVLHWKIQVHPAQHLRRSLLTRCAWCHGRSRKSDPVNVSHSWDGPRGHWWQGEPGLYHQDCSSAEHAHRSCLCAEPDLGGREYGTCFACGQFRGFGADPDEADRLLAAIPRGGRITPDVRPAVEAAWAARRARRDMADRD